MHEEKIKEILEYIKAKKNEMHHTQLAIHVAELYNLEMPYALLIVGASRNEELKLFC